MSSLPACPQCGMTHTYPDRSHYVCPDCAHEWPMQPTAAGQDDQRQVRDAHGQVLASGDHVLVIKDLKVKGSSVVLKQGTLIRNIRLVDDDPEHIEGHSDKVKGLVLKACFVKKA